jgi:hypothetical protein
VSVLSAATTSAAPIRLIPLRDIAAVQADQPPPKINAVTEKAVISPQSASLSSSGYPASSLSAGYRQN